METSPATKRVLLVDDDRVTNMINSKIITRQTNLEVEAYTNAQEMLDKCHQWLASNPDQFPDIIFLDINMPIMDGWEFLNEFEKLPLTMLKKCSVYLLTSSIDENDIEKSKQHKTVKEFISKPLTVNKINMLMSNNIVNGIS